jgi:hypothetical protein
MASPRLGLQGNYATVRWRRYYESTRTYADGGEQISTQNLAYDNDRWSDTISVPVAKVPWQLQVTVFGPGGTQLATGHSAFTYRPSCTCLY